MKLFLLLLAAAGLGRAQTPAAVGDVYHLSPDFPKYVTAHIEFRDPSEQRWPSFFYGKPAPNGSISISAAKPLASFTLNLDERPQKNGDQSRRVLGEFFAAPDKGGVSLEISGMGAIAPKVGSKQAELQTTFTGTLKVAGKSASVSGSGTLRVHPGGRGDEKNSALLGEMAFETKAAELGLKTFPADAVIQVKASFTAYPPGAGQRRK